MKWRQMEQCTSFEEAGLGRTPVHLPRGPCSEMRRTEFGTFARTQSNCDWTRHQLHCNAVLASVQQRPEPAVESLRRPAGTRRPETKHGPATRPPNTANARPSPRKLS